MLLFVLGYTLVMAINKVVFDVSLQVENAVPAAKKTKVC